jgi:hypothetical protein
MRLGANARRIKGAQESLRYAREKWASALVDGWAGPGEVAAMERTIEHWMRVCAELERTTPDKREWPIESRNCGTCRFWRRRKHGGDGRCAFLDGKPLPWWHVGMTGAVTWPDDRRGDNCPAWDLRRVLGRTSQPIVP